MKPTRPRSVTVPAEFFREVADHLARRTPVVVVTVLEASGSAPGKAGAKMLVTADGLSGTVGGGRVEKAALDKARSLLGEEREPESVRYDVVQDLGMTCGGSMVVLFEPLTPAPRLVIFGAGHIAQPLSAMAALAGFEVTVCDERAEWLTPERFPDARRLVAEWEAAVEQAGIDAATYVTSIGPGHAFDERVVLALARGPVRPLYLGVIGSRRKAIVLRKGLQEKGCPADLVERIHIPMGLNLGAVDPREIAVAILAELVALRRGVETITSW